MKERYERPVIQLQTEGQRSHFAYDGSSRARTAIEGVPVSKLVDQFGSPLFVFSERTLRRQYKDLYRAFSVRYPAVQLAWSYKTNYLRTLSTILHSEGAWAEVVSEFEYEMACQMGIPGPKIIFNGPFKSVSGLERAVKDGALINLDNTDELYAMFEIAEKFGKSVDVGIRINLDAGLETNWSRFGFNLENGEARKTVRMAVESGKLNITGLHCHVGTFILDTEIYRRQAKKLVSFAHDIQKDFGVALKYIDVGGGFASTNTLHYQYLTGEQISPSFDQYAEAICNELLTLESPSGTPPLLILETGRAVVDESGFLIASVVNTKRLTTGIRAITLDVGVNALITSWWYKHEIIPAQDFVGVPEATVIYGPLCMMIDVIRDYLMLPPLVKGDRVVVKPVGAYNCAQWMQWIQARPAVALIKESGDVDLIRNRETVEDLYRQEIIPEKTDF